MEYKLHALLHDAAEAYFNDLSTPVKHAFGMETYRSAEKHAQKMVYWRFGLDSFEVPEIKEADNAACKLERAALIQPFPFITAVDTILTNEEAEEAYLDHFAYYFKEHHDKPKK
jgi:5'-deoxynucleotidase YfbR-like HD superfamily hydrolase